MAHFSKENNYSNRMKRSLEKIELRMAECREELAATDSIDQKVAIHARLNKLNSDRINKVATIAKHKQLLHLQYSKAGASSRTI